MKSKERLVVTFLALFVFISMSVGYALYGAKVDILGKAMFKKNGKVAITNAILSSYSNLNNPKNPTYTDDSISFDLSFTVERNQAAFEKEYSATYEITISNTSFYDYAFQAGSFTPSLTTSSNEDMVVTYTMDGIEINEIIPSGSSKTFTMKIIMYPNTYGNFNVSGDAGVDLEEKEDDGSLLASIPKNIVGDLSGSNDKVKITATVVNSYKTDKSFTFSLGNQNFYLVDSNGNNISTYVIEPNATKDYDLYIMQKDGTRFPTDRQNMNVFFEPVDQAKSSMGLVSIIVDVDHTITDDKPPVVNNVTSSFQETKGSVLVTYDGTDNVGIDHYVIETYKSDGTLVKTNQTVADESSYIVTGLEDGSYYFKVIAYDASGNHSEAISPTNSFKWTFSVSITITNGTPNGTYTVDYNGTYEVIIQGSGDRKPPASLTVTMDGQNYTAYSYSADSGQLKIPNVKGDLVITGTARNNITCLVEGTKIKLANGKYKNIEDIKYDDLLEVWSFELGKTVYEYPIWIEKKATSSMYRKITFDDGTILKTVGFHGIFSFEHDKFVSVDDSDKFKVGDTVARIENGKIKKIKVSSIELIEEKVNYYHIESTRYYNVIANDILTTDGYVDLINLYPFNDKVIWQGKDKVINNPNNLYKFKDFDNKVPMYFYKGLRMAEVKHLENNKVVTKEKVIEILENTFLKDEITVKPITKNGYRYWMVTTSLDKVTNKDNYLYKEGSFYKLAKNKNVKYYYSTSENKKYKPGSKVKVYTGMYFEAIKK